MTATATTEPAPGGASAQRNDIQARPARAQRAVPGSEHNHKKGRINWAELDWVVVGGAIALHAFAALALIPLLFTWSGLVMAGIMTFVASCLGITLCYHRLLSHRSFKTPKWFEYVLATCGCLAWQGGPIGWVGTHRLHHQHSDTEHDPHSPEHGFTWAHVLWFVHRYHHGVHRTQAATDLMKDRGLRFLEKYSWLPIVGLMVLLFAGGWAFAALGFSEKAGWVVGTSWVVWAVAVRTVLFFHLTWFVNSAGHTWGYQNYKDTGDRSTNLWWLALFSFGEGWHNNHHANPRSAAHGLRWFEFDITYCTIKVLGWVGLAKKINLPPAERMPGGMNEPAKEVPHDPKLA
ncbi:acyl-CoA desaturase [Phycisphaera mikurensis]|uniref:acyl-CoA desaturase n=1 Tax=Phycisphaera mikurensis TaxID=547188 RepID=UPI00069DBC2C|nr:fatty acid desaturase [Phycisphaera mikurensis]MBB6440999.1 stearoyl-CoA desaturase (delta-9 desaturase) [Phycisphaera mikurensis]